MTRSAVLNMQHQQCKHCKYAVTTVMLQSPHAQNHFPRATHRPCSARAVHGMFKAASAWGRNPAAAPCSKDLPLR